MTRGLLERLNPLYSPIPFSITAEDVLVVENALEVRPGDHVVCLGAAGDTPLSLLRTDPGQVDAVDSSFPQICEIVLKAEAIRRLALPEVHTLLGVEKGRRGAALALYEQLRGTLPTEVASFWDRHRWMIRRGLLWQGGIQRMIRAGRRALSLTAGRRAMESLRGLSSRKEAEDWVRRAARSWRFRLLTRMVVNPLTSAWYPSVGRSHLGADGDLRQYMVQRLEEMLVRRPPGRYPQLAAFLFDAYPSEASLPPYLHPADFDAIRARIDRLRPLHADLGAHLASLPERSVQGFALSNVIDWLSDEGLAALYRQVCRSGVAGAGLLVYSRSRDRRPPADLADALALDEELSRRLAAQDRIGYYRFTYAFRLRGT